MPKFIFKATLFVVSAIFFSFAFFAYAQLDEADPLLNKISFLSPWLAVVIPFVFSVLVVNFAFSGNGSFKSGMLAVGFGLIS